MLEGFIVKKYFRVCFNLKNHIEICFKNEKYAVSLKLRKKVNVLLVKELYKVSFYLLLLKNDFISSADSSFNTPVKISALGWKGEADPVIL
jgi:hypothetical protein